MLLPPRAFVDLHTTSSISRYYSYNLLYHTYVRVLRLQLHFSQCRLAVFHVCCPGVPGAGAFAPPSSPRGSDCRPLARTLVWCPITAASGRGECHGSVIDHTVNSGFADLIRAGGTRHFHPSERTPWRSRFAPVGASPAHRVSPHRQSLDRRVHRHRDFNPDVQASNPSKTQRPPRTRLPYLWIALLRARSCLPRRLAPGYVILTLSLASCFVLAPCACVCI